MMKELRKLNSIIDSELEKNLIRMDFYKKSKNLFELKLDNFNKLILIIEKTNRRNNEMWYVNPIVGIYNSKIENLYYTLVDSVNINNKNILVTASESLGYLMPTSSYVTWDFSLKDSSSKFSSIINNLIFNIKEVAIPFFSRLLDYDVLLKSLKNNELGITKSNYYRVPIIYFLQNRKELGVNYILKVLDLERPSPKNKKKREFNFENITQVQDFFLRDKDLIFYFNYLKFKQKYLLIN